MSSDRIHRHNRVRNLLDRICQEGMLSPVMEKYRLLGDVYGRRPGDVTIPVWRANKGLAIDVAVTSPFGSHRTYLAQSLARALNRRSTTQHLREEAKTGSQRRAQQKKSFGKMPGRCTAP